MPRKLTVAAVPTRLPWLRHFSATELGRTQFTTVASTFYAEFVMKPAPVLDHEADDAGLLLRERGDRRPPGRRSTWRSSCTRPAAAADRRRGRGRDGRASTKDEQRSFQRVVLEPIEVPENAALAPR